MGPDSGTARGWFRVGSRVVSGRLNASFGTGQVIELGTDGELGGGPEDGIDVGVHDWAVVQRYTGATTFFDLMSTIGGPVGVGVIAALVAIALLITKRFRWTIYLLLNVGIGGGIDMELKRYFARARPAVAQQLMHATGYSFPSGHAMGSTVLFATLSYLAIRILPRWRWKSAALALCTTLIVSVALSRVYLGVHWISDVGAGIVAGLLWVTMTTVAYETFRRIRLIRKLRVQAAAHEYPRSS